MNMQMFSICSEHTERRVMQNMLCYAPLIRATRSFVLCVCYMLYAWCSCVGESDCSLERKCTRAHTRTHADDEKPADGAQEDGQHNNFSRGKRLKSLLNLLAGKKVCLCVYKCVGKWMCVSWPKITSQPLGRKEGVCVCLHMLCWIVDLCVWQVPEVTAQPHVCVCVCVSARVCVSACACVWQVPEVTAQPLGKQEGALERGTIYVCGEGEKACFLSLHDSQ